MWERTSGMDPVQLGIPKGSLQDATIELLRRAGWSVSVSSRNYVPGIDDDHVRCKLVRAQEISRYVEDGSLDAGITGLDWTLENASDVRVVADLVYSKASFQPTRWVLAVPNDSPAQCAEDLQGGKIATELVNFSTKYFSDRGIDVSVEFSWGATELKAAEGLADAIVEVTETETTIRAHGLRVIETLTTSNPQLIANHTAYADPDKRRKIDQIALLLKGALEAESRVGLKMNVPRAKGGGHRRGAAEHHRADGRQSLRHRLAIHRNRRVRARGAGADPGASRQGRRGHHRVPAQQDRLISGARDVDPAASERLGRCTGCSAREAPRARRSPPGGGRTRAARRGWWPARARFRASGPGCR